MHSLPGFIIFFHEVSFFLPTNIGISSEPPHFACLFSFIAKNLNIEIVFVSLHRLTNNLFIFITITGLNTKCGMNEYLFLQQ